MLLFLSLTGPSEGFSTDGNVRNLAKVELTQTLKLQGKHTRMEKTNNMVAVVVWG